MKCINCGKNAKNLIDVGMGFKICQACEDTNKILTDLLKQGIDVEYNNGTKKTFRSKE